MHDSYEPEVETFVDKIKRWVRSFFDLIAPSPFTIVGSSTGYGDNVGISQRSGSISGDSAGNSQQTTNTLIITNSTTMSDIYGLSLGILVTNPSTLVVNMNLEVESNKNDRNGYFAINVNGVDRETINRFNLNYHNNIISISNMVELTPGRYIIKGRWCTDADNILTINNSNLTTSVRSQEPFTCSLCGTKQTSIRGDTFHRHCGEMYCKPCHHYIHRKCRTNADLELLKLLENKKRIAKQNYIEKRLEAIE